MFVPYFSVSFLFHFVIRYPKTAAGIAAGAAAFWFLLS